MKLGIIASPDRGGFEWAKGLGLSFVEFDINVGQDAQAFYDRVPELKAASAETGVAVGAVGRWGGQKISADGLVEAEVEANCTLVRAAAALGSPVFITGCNFVEELSYYDNCRLAIAYFSRLIAVGKECGVKICTYNCRWDNFVCTDMAYTMIHGHLPELGIKYDPSHSIYDGVDYLAEMRKWGDRFDHVHIKGSLIAGGSRFDDPPAGLDGTNWGAFMAILYAKGYQGGLSLEPHSENWRGELGDWGVRYTIDYIRPMIKN